MSTPSGITASPPAAARPAFSSRCWITGCLGYCTGVAVVDGLAVVSTFCPAHAERREWARRALHPCSYFEGCTCAPGEPSGPCAAWRDRYLERAVAEGLCSGPERGLLAAIAAVELNPAVSAALAASPPPSDRQWCDPTGVALPNGTRPPRRSGLTVSA
jgi:hypothetical protein